MAEDMTVAAVAAAATVPAAHATPTPTPLAPPAPPAPPAVAAGDPLLDMSIRELGVLMARVVTRGHTEEEKRSLEAAIVAGVEAYRLTALVLCARRPPSEALARRILSQRQAEDAEDGVFWAVVEFIERSRSGELAKIISSTTTPVQA
jgi:hypothetical protein